MRRTLLLALALLIAALGTAPTADAASSKRCKALAVKAKSKVVKKGKTALIMRRGTVQNLTLVYQACLYRKPRLYKLPEQNGGDTEYYGDFTVAGDFLAYEHVNAEEASGYNPGWIEVVNLNRRLRTGQYDAFPQGAEDELTTSVSQILLRTDGAVAWIGTTFGDEDHSVQTARRGQSRAAEVDRGKDVDPKSLRRSTQSADVFSWARGGVTKEAAFGGPTVTP